MRALIACETSGRSREAFRRRGWDAWSCDLLPADDGSPHHIVGDALALLGDGWDLMIAHPPCTRLTNSGVRWLDERNLWAELDEAAALFRALLEAPIPHKCIENPIPHKHALHQHRRRARRAHPPTAAQRRPLEDPQRDLSGHRRCLRRPIHHRTGNRMSTITALKTWMRAAEPAEQELLAKRIGSSRGYLYQLSGAHRTASSEIAIQIETETKAMHKASKGRLPIVYRTDLSTACRGCEFARRCLGEEVVVRSEFPVVTDDGSEGGSPD